MGSVSGSGFRIKFRSTGIWIGGSAMRKVYAGNTSNLGKGARCALPLHPSGPGFCSGIYPIIPFAIQFRVPLQFLSNSMPGRRHRRSHQNVSPFNHSQGRLRSIAAPHRLGRRSCPQDPRPFHGDAFSATISLRPTFTRIGCRQCFGAGPEQSKSSLESRPVCKNWLPEIAATRVTHRLI